MVIKKGIWKWLKSFTLRLKKVSWVALFHTTQSRRPFLRFTQILSAKYFFPNSKKYKKQAKLKAILETSTFRTPKIKIFKSNGLFCNFYPNLLKTSFILKMSKRANFQYPKQQLLSQMDRVVHLLR